MDFDSYSDDALIMLKLLTCHKICKENKTLSKWYNSLRQYTEIKPRVIKYRRLLRNRLLRHRWHDVFHIVKNITTQQFNDNSLLYNVSMEYIQQMKSDDIGHLKNLVFQLQNSTLHYITPIEYIMLLISRSKFDDVIYTLQNLKNDRYVHPKKRISAKYKHDKRLDKLLLQLYKGQCLYHNWKKEIIKQATIENQTSMPEYTKQDLLEYQKLLVNTAARRAENSFKCLTKKKGVWDIFICKQKELLMHSGQLKDCERYLRTNQQTNPNNLNAHVQYYTFLKQYMLPKCVKVLQEIHKIDSSHKLNLELFVNLYRTDCEKSVSVIFQYLDNSICKNDFKAWKYLLKLLKKANKNKDGVYLHILECWNYRRSWWVEYQFPLDDDSDDNITNFYKIYSTIYLLGSRNVFYEQHCSLFESHKNYDEMAFEVNSLQKTSELFSHEQL